MEAGKHYHIYTHANGFENLFQSAENYGYFLKRYEHFIPPVADTFVWCLMPNHLHFLIRIKTEAELIATFFSNLQSNQSNFESNVQSNLQGFENLGGLDGDLNGGLDGSLEKEIEKRISQQFSNLFNAYTKAYNKMYGRKGSLFIPNFKRKEITSDSYLTTVIRYIHTNPVHHGFTKNLADWPWSSYNTIISDTPSFIKKEEVINWFGNLNQFITFHQQPTDLKTRQEMDF